MQRVPALVGVAGHFKDEVFPLRYGKTLTVGRSRSADFSLKRTEKYRVQTAEEREADESAQTISSKHFQITMYNWRSIEIKNLSPNGTTVDGKAVDHLVINDAMTQTHEIQFGVEEAVRLEVREIEDQE
jgi:hypothetical protein